MRSLLRASAVLFTAVASLGAQSGPAGSINGHVVDQSQGAVPGVTVTATHDGTAETRTVVTNENGFYTIAALPVGRYAVIFQLEGFKTVTRPNVGIEAAVPLTINANLEVGGIAESVTVQAEAAVLQVSTAAVARQLTNEELTAVPSSTRNFTHLLT
ncbi:MAG: carboxypeptidase-like regulatory domain-containing protein, partial [Gammaproteobacteria bacterium]